MNRSVWIGLLASLVGMALVAPGERLRGIEINRRDLTLGAWTIGRAVCSAVRDRHGVVNFPVNRSLQFGYSTSATETRGRKEPGYRAMHARRPNMVEFANGTHQLRANVRQSFKRRSIHFDAR